MLHYPLSCILHQILVLNQVFFFFFKIAHGSKQCLEDSGVIRASCSLFLSFSCSFVDVMELTCVVYKRVDLKVFQWTVYEYMCDSVYVCIVYQSNIFSLHYIFQLQSLLHPFSVRSSKPITIYFNSNYKKYFLTRKSIVYILFHSSVNAIIPTGAHPQ